MTSFILLLLLIYFLGITTLLAWLSDLSKEKTEKFPSWQAAIAGDLNGVGSLENIKNGGIYQNNKVGNPVIT